MNAFVYLEGGGSGANSKELQIGCQKGFHKLLEKCGFTGRMPRLVPCGGRHAAFDNFKTAHAAKGSCDYVAMLIDSEEPVSDLEATWAHLRNRDKWEKPDQAADNQVLFMTTCMETWIVADRAALREHFQSRLQDSALPPLSDLEDRDRHKIQDRLSHATRECSNHYQKGKRSFEILALLDPVALEKHLPSFARARRILREKL